MYQSVAIDIIQIVGSLAALACAGMPRLRDMNLPVSAASVLGCILAWQHCGMLCFSGALSKLAAASLALVTVLSFTQNNYVAALHILKGVYFMWMLVHGFANKSYLVSIIIHAFVAWSMLKPNTQHMICRHIRGILHIDVLRTIRLLRSGKFSKDDFTSQEDRQAYIRLKSRFYWEPKQSYSILRAIFYMAWREMFVVHLLKSLADVLHNFQNIALLHVLETSFEGNMQQSSSFWTWLIIWMSTYISIPLNEYMDVKESFLYDSIYAIINENIIACYLSQKSDYDSAVYSIQDHLDNAYNSIDGLRTVMYFITEELSGLVAIYILVSKMGWKFAFAIFATIALSFGIPFAQAWLDNYADTVTEIIPVKLQALGKAIIQNMHTIKQYAWESKLLNIVDYTDGPTNPMHTSFIYGLIKHVAYCVPKIVAAVAVLRYVNNCPEMSYVELASLLYQIGSLIKNTELIVYIKPCISDIIEMELTAQKSLSFSHYKYIHKQLASDNSMNSVEIADCQFGWGENKYSLQPLSLTVKSGSFVTVVGKVGSGKSSLLSALAGEMPLLLGAGTVKGNIGYVSQKPWIMNATFRQNVLLGHEYEADWYNQVITACALDDDILQLPAADMTEIGHKGINLSGGQKARLALARAIYTKADMYLLDDVLSAVDSQVERHLIEHVLAGQGILATKTRILVTHAEPVVPLSDMVITMVNGTASIKKGEANKVYCPPSDDYDKLHMDTQSEQVDSDMTSETDNDTSSSQAGFNINPELEAPQLGVASRIWKFLKLSGYKIVLLVIIIEMGNSLLPYYSGVKRKELLRISESHLDKVGVKNYILLDVVTDILKREFLNIKLFVITHIWHTHALASMRKKLLNHIAYLPITTFERLSQHTLLSMYDSKMYRMAHEIVYGLSGYTLLLANTACGVASVLFISPYVIMAILAVVFARLKLDSYLQKASEVFDTHIKAKHNIDTETLEGEIVDGHEMLRIHEKSDVFVEQLSEANSAKLVLEKHGVQIKNIQHIPTKYVEMSITLIILFWYKWIYVYHGLKISPGEVYEYINIGMLAYNSMSGLMCIEPGLRNSLTSLSKYFVFAEQLEQEAPHHIENSNLPSSWPSSGIIEFKDYSMKYRADLPNTLCNVSFSTRKYEKVGIVGRTGAGKSSLTSALLRLVEAATGSIVIDGMDISTIGLYDLRSHISMVPQDPMLLEGTIRANLDPAMEYSDAELWEVIAKCHIGDLLNKPDAKGNTGLNTWVEEDGKNFSVGQRQLFSLCRALLWKRTILILDEATANIDNKTDQLMQEIIKTEFQHCTVLTIAHRLKTVMDSDRIMVLDQGTIAEFDTPENLLAQSDSQFSSMVESMKLNENSFLDSSAIG